MIKRYLAMRWLLLFLLIIISTEAVADTRLLRDDIVKRLSDNSMIWRSDGDVSTQYFDSRGYTIYENVGKTPEIGLWSVSNDHLFCSKWKTTAWQCYQVLLAADGIIFTGPVNQPLTFKNTMKGRLVFGNRTTGKLPQEKQQSITFAQSIGKLLDGDYLGSMLYK